MVAHSCSFWLEVRILDRSIAVVEDSSVGHSLDYMAVAVEDTLERGTGCSLEAGCTEGRRTRRRVLTF